MKTVITFDFDGTLGHVPHIQKLAKMLLFDQSNDVHIVTRRYSYLHEKAGDEFSEVIALADRFGIKRENVHFTNREYKVGKLKQLGSHIHYDDDRTEILLIRQHYPDCRGFLVLN